MQEYAPRMRYSTKADCHMRASEHVSGRITSKCAWYQGRIVQQLHCSRTNCESARFQAVSVEALLRNVGGVADGELVKAPMRSRLTSHDRDNAAFLVQNL